MSKHRPGAAESAAESAPQPVADPWVRRLAYELERFDDRVRRWSNARWQGEARNGRPRADIAYDLALTLADLGRAAGNGAPLAVPERLAPHAIADQLAVLGREILTAPAGQPVAGCAQAATEAIERVSGEIFSL
jgi:hypothetical protein